MTSQADSTDFARNMRKTAVVLLFAGVLLVFLHKQFLNHQESFNNESWTVAIESSHFIEDDRTVIHIQPAYESLYVRQTSRNINHPGLKLLPPSANVESRRAIRLRAREEGRYQVISEYALQLSREPFVITTAPLPLSEKRRAYFLSITDVIKQAEPQLLELLATMELDGLSAEQIASRIFDRVSAKTHRERIDSRPLELLVSADAASQYEKSVLMVAMARLSDIPARLVTGIELKEDPLSTPLYWVEFYLDDNWKGYYSGPERRGDVPYTLVAFDKSGNGMVYSSEGGSISVDIVVERNPVSFRSPETGDGEWSQLFIFDRYPLETREQLALLMLLPLGTLLCSFIRQILQVHSYGVFTPTMLALAFVYAEFVTTLLILFITLCLVYFGRPTFSMGMSRTPRLSIIFTLVAGSMILGVSLLDYFGLAADGQLVLLPIVILTSLLDRFFSTIESRGYRSAIIRLIWTMVLVVLVLPVTQLDKLGMWLLRYPEAHLVTLSLLLMMTYYPLPSYKLPAWLGMLAEPEKKVRRSSRRKVDRDDDG